MADISLPECCSNSTVGTFPDAFSFCFQSAISSSKFDKSGYSDVHKHAQHWIHCRPVLVTKYLLNGKYQKLPATGIFQYFYTYRLGFITVLSDLLAVHVPFPSPDILLESKYACVTDPFALTALSWRLKVVYACDYKAQKMLLDPLQRPRCS